MTNINKTQQEINHENVTSTACRLTAQLWFNNNQKDGIKSFILPARFASALVDRCMKSY